VPGFFQRDVAVRLGSRREFVKHGRTGLLYQAGNIEELAAALSWLDRRPDLAAAMGHAAREFVREHHSPVQHYESMIALYERLATETGGVKKETSRIILAPGTSKPRLRTAFIGGRGVIGKYSGIEGYYEEVGRRLAASGHKVTVYCRPHILHPATE
jgi:hypothetical protein